MSDYRNSNYSQSSTGPSLKQPVELMDRTLTGNSQYTHPENTHSRAQSNQQTIPGSLPPPAQSTDTPTPRKAVRPLPNPHAQTAIRRPLHVVNVPDIVHGEERNEAHMKSVVNHPGYRSERFENGNTAETITSRSGGFVRPQKKKSFVGGFVKRIRRLPKSVFGYGAGIGGSDTGTLQRSGTLMTEASTITSGNTLPVYTSKPSTPIAAIRRSEIPGQYIPGLMISEPTEPPIPESPPPEVVRLSSHRASVPQHNFTNEEHSRAGGGPILFSRNPTKKPSDTHHLERTTVMLYQDHNSQYYEGNQVVPRPTPPAVSRQPSDGSALSYAVESLVPLQPARAASFHSSHTSVLPPLEIPKRVPTPGPNGPRVSYASQAPPPHRMTQSLIPGSHHSSSPPTQYEVQIVPPTSLQQGNPAPPQPIEGIQSPVTAHPEHTVDYLKMTLSPPPTSHNTFATGSSHYDPSFSSQLNPVERFFTTLYRMPWVSHGRITVDYLPGAGVGVRRKRKMKPIASWYRSFVSGSSRSGETIDATSNGTEIETSRRASLGASLAMILASPLSGRSSNQHRHRAKRRRSHDESKDSHKHRHHSSRRQHYRPRHTHINNKNGHISMNTVDSGTVNNDGYARTESSPLIPSVYPYQYPPFPYAPFPSLPLPVPVPIVEEERSKSRSKGRHVSPRGPRAVQQQPPVFYAPAPGFASYASPPQLYFLQSPTSMPPALIPGGAHQDTHAHGAQHEGGKAQQKAQPAVVGSGAPTIPGAFSSP